MTVGTSDVRCAAAGVRADQKGQPTYERKMRMEVDEEVRGQGRLAGSPGGGCRRVEEEGSSSRRQQPWLKNAHVRV